MTNMQKAPTVDEWIGLLQDLERAQTALRRIRTEAIQELDRIECDGGTTGFARRIQSRAEKGLK